MEVSFTEIVESMYVNLGANFGSDVHATRITTQTDTKPSRFNNMTKSLVPLLCFISARQNTK